MKKLSVAQYISDGRAAGKTDSEITHELLDAGWHMDIIAKAMHGEPIKHRRHEPILDIKKQPLRKSVLAGLGLLLIAMLAAAFL
jgi:hypothetical protein